MNACLPATGFGSSLIFRKSSLGSNIESETVSCVYDAHSFYLFFFYFVLRWAIRVLLFNPHYHEFLSHYCQRIYTRSIYSNLWTMRQSKMPFTLNILLFFIAIEVVIRKINQYIVMRWLKLTTESQNLGTILCGGIINCFV